MKTSITLLIIGLILYAAAYICVPIIDRAQAQTARHYGPMLDIDEPFNLVREVVK